MALFNGFVYFFNYLCCLIIKKIINDHKGTVSVESEYGIGTKFIIRLPLLNE